MDNKMLLDKYRAHFVVALAITITIVTAVEIGAYILFVTKGICALSLDDSYLRYKVITPILINLLDFFAVAMVNRSKKLRHNFKNRAIIFGASVASFVVSAVHREFVVTLGAFMFPMILSAMFNDRKLLKQSCIVSLLALTTTVVLLWHDGAVDLTNFINIVVMYGFLSVSYIAGFISIKFSQRSFQLIENQAMANSHLQNIVLRDQMTGLYNHRAFYSELDISIENAQLENEDFCLAMIDIDNFKNVNDSYGHDCGDSVLINLAGIINRHCDSEDKACRYGGEEFAVIFNRKSLHQAKKVMKTILDEFSKTAYDFTDKPITFSCGMARFENKLTREEIFNIADKRMYRAKNNGKNQIIAA